MSNEWKRKGVDPEYGEQQIKDFIEQVSSGFLVSDEATTDEIFTYLQNRPGVRFDRLESSLIVKHGWSTDITLSSIDKVEAKLPLKPVIEAACAQGWARSNYSRREGLDSMVLEQMRNYTDPTSAATFTSVINDLGKANRWPLNTNGNEERLREAIQKAKAAILQGKKQWPQWDPRYGQVKWRDAGLLDSMTVEQLLATIEQVSSLYKQMAGSREDQRERLANFADAAAGIRRYREGDVDSLSGTVQYKDNSHNNAFEFVGEHSQVKPTANPRMERGTTASVLSAEASQLFTDPATGKFYTKTALHKLARTNTNLFRTMMRSGHVDFMNQLLAQEN